MANAYQYNASGIFIGEVEDYGLLPNNATYIPPSIVPGFIPQWNGTSWEQMEDHRGEEGYLNGLAHTIKEFGPYPAGWSSEPPEPTFEDQIAALQSRYAANLRAKLDEINVAVALDDKEALAAKRAEYAVLVEEQKAVVDAVIIGGAA